MMLSSDKSGYFPPKQWNSELPIGPLQTKFVLLHPWIVQWNLERASTLHSLPDGRVHPPGLFDGFNWFERTNILPIFRSLFCNIVFSETAYLALCL